MYTCFYTFHKYIRFYVYSYFNRVILLYRFLDISKTSFQLLKDISKKYIQTHLYTLKLSKLILISTEINYLKIIIYQIYL